MLANSGWTLQTLSAVCALLLVLLAASWAWIIVLYSRTRKKVETLQLKMERFAASEKRVQQVQRMEAIGKLAGGSAHSFNNHLTSILGFSELLLEMIPPKDKSREPIEAIHRAATRGSEFTRQLFAINRKQSLQMQLLNLNTLVTEMSPALRILAGEKIVLRLELDSALGSAMLDKAQTEVVVTNLVTAARDSMPGGGQITIETRNVEFAHPFVRDICELKPGSYVQLVISDNGPGMDENTRGHIFEPFFFPKQKTKGSGIALAIVYGIVKQSNGEISVSGDVGKGTTFAAYFPRLQQQ